jgi:hypothetical protein
MDGIAFSIRSTPCPHALRTSRTNERERDDKWASYDRNVRAQFPPFRHPSGWSSQAHPLKFQDESCRYEKFGTLVKRDMGQIALDYLEDAAVVQARRLEDTNDVLKGWNSRGEWTRGRAGPGQESAGARVSLDFYFGSDAHRSGGEHRGLEHCEWTYERAHVADLLLEDRRQNLQFTWRAQPLHLNVE